MSNDNDSEGFGATADLIKKLHRSGGTPLGVDAMLKLWSGADLSKAARLPPQSDDAEDDEEIGVSGGTGTEPVMHPSPKKRKRRGARDASDPNQARRMRADRDDADEDEDEDDDECRDDADEGSWPPASPKGRADRDEVGRFAARQRRTTKMIKALHASGPRPLTADELLDPQRLAKVESGRVAQQRDLLAKLEGATTALRRGERIDPVALAKAVGAVVGYRN